MDFTGQQMSENFITDIHMELLEGRSRKIIHKELAKTKNLPLENLRLYSTY